MAVNLKSIKIENVKSVFSSVAAHTVASRLSISEETGLSRVTVGKIADALILENILTEEKKINNSAGRRAGMLSLSSDKVAVVGAIGENGVRILIYDIGMNPCAAFECSLDDDELVNLLADASMTILDKYGADNCIGISLIISDNLDGAHYKEMFASFFPDMMVYTDSPMNLSAQHYASESDEDELLLYISVGREHVRGSFAMKNRLPIYRDGHSSDLGATVSTDGKRLIDELNCTSDRETCTKMIAQCICNVALVILPTSAVIEMDERYYYDSIENDIKRYSKDISSVGVMDNLRIIPSDPECTSQYQGALCVLFDKWLDSFVLGK